MKRTITMLLMAIMCAAIAFGAPSNATVNQGVSSSWAASGPAGTVDAVGGNVTLVNVSGDVGTARWAGFYGEISSGYILGDSGGSSFYEWTVTDVTGAVVYACNGTVSNWNLNAATTAVLPTYLTQNSPDNWTNTFTSTEDFNISTTNVANVPYAQTWQSGSQGTLKTYSLADPDDNDLIFAGLADDGATSFNGGTVDYQILAPADNGGVTYNFYLQLP